MPDERRKGPPERPRSRAANPAQAGEQNVTSPTGTPDVHANERARGQDPNDIARFDAEELDASIRIRQQEDRGEVH